LPNTACLDEQDLLPDPDSWTHPVQMLDDASGEASLQFDGDLDELVEVICTDAKHLQHPGEGSDKGGKNQVAMLEIKLKSGWKSNQIKVGNQVATLEIKLK